LILSRILHFGAQIQWVQELNLSIQDLNPLDSKSEFTEFKIREELSKIQMGEI
jgi:hypothetical protein